MFLFIGSLSNVLIAQDTSTGNKKAADVLARILGQNRHPNSPEENKTQTPVTTEYPDELRIVAKSLAEELFPDVDKALEEPSEKESRLKLLTYKLDLAKVKSKDTEIQLITTDALTAFSEVITRLDRIKDLPKPDNWAPFWGGLLDGSLLVMGAPPTGASIQTVQDETAKGNAIAIEVQAFIKAFSKAETAQRLLPRVCKQYCAVPTKTNNDERISVRFHSLLEKGGMYILTNQGEALDDCLFEITVSNSSGKKATFCGFAERWEQGQVYYVHGIIGFDLGNEEMLGQMCVPQVSKVEVTLLSPKFSTSVQYAYDKAERGKTYAILFKNVKATGSYQKKEPGIFSDYQRSFTTTLATEQNLPACRYSVTFSRQNGWREREDRETWFRDLKGWKNGESVKIEPGNDKFTFEPDTVEVEISFPDSTHTLEWNWPVNN
jgi:hypothetical protein